MDALAAALATLGRKLAQDAVGPAVAARWFVRTADDIQRSADAVLSGLANWFGHVERVMALGNAEAGPLDVHLVFDNGRSAVVHVSRAAAGREVVDAIVWGARGTLSWSPGDALALEGEDVSVYVTSLAWEVIERSLAGRCTMRIEPGGGLVEVGDVAAEQRLERGGVTSKKPVKALTPPFGVLLVAGGHTHQESYGAEFHASPRCRVVGVTDGGDASPRRRALNARLAERWGVPVLPDYAAALARRDVDIVCLCAEPERRTELAIAAAAAGKPIYLDKPLAATTAEADRIMQAVARAGVHSQMFSLEEHPLAQVAGSAVAAGSHGALAGWHSDLTFAKGYAGAADLDQIRRETSPAMAHEALDAKRELYCIGLYALTTARHVLASPLARISCSTSNYFFREHQQRDMEDFALVLAETQDGIAFSAAVGRTGWQSHPAGGVNRIWIVGADGAECLDAHRPRAELWAPAADWRPPPRHPDDPMGFWRSTCAEAGMTVKPAWAVPEFPAGADVEAFLDALEQGWSPTVDVALAADVTEWLAACYQSAARGAAVVV